MWRWFLADVVSAGLIEAPGFFSDPLLRRAYSARQWVGDEMVSIDPKKEAEGQEIRLRNHTTTLERETMQTLGTDWRDVVRQRGREKRALVDAGLRSEPAVPNEPAREDEGDE